MSTRSPYVHHALRGSARQGLSPFARKDKDIGNNIGTGGADGVQRRSGTFSFDDSARPSPLRQQQREFLERNRAASSDAAASPRTLLASGAVSGGTGAPSPGSRSFSARVGFRASSSDKASEPSADTITGDDSGGGSGLSSLEEIRRERRRMSISRRRYTLDQQRRMNQAMMGQAKLTRTPSPIPLYQDKVRLQVISRDIYLTSSPCAPTHPTNRPTDQPSGC